MISIIIPVYNTESFIEICIESILKQTYRNFQIILIDDGSSDKSGVICDSFSEEYQFVHVIHKENGGVSSARNVGLEYIGAETDYVFFVDSDDYLDRDCLEMLISNAEEFDVIACGLRKINNDGIVLFEQKTKEIELRDKQSIIDSYSGGVIKEVFYGPVAKLYKSSLVSLLSFDESLAIGEDIVFNIQFLAQASSVKVIDYTGYNYRINSSSATQSSSNKYTQDYEHDNRYIRDRIRAERILWGIDESILRQNDIQNFPIRYYNEITNLFRPGTPYSKQTVCKKIQVINNDSDFSCMSSMSFFHLSNAEKISKLCWIIHNPHLCYWLIRLVLKWKREI